MRISKFKAKKALLEHLSANNQGVQVIPEGSDIQPSADAAYLKESVLYGPNAITIDPNGGDTLRGIYQIDVCTLISNKDFANLALCDSIIDSFQKGRLAGIAYNGQIIEIQNIDITQMVKNEANTHLVHYISVNFIAV